MEESRRVKEAVDAFRAGQIDRGGAVKRLLGFGMSAPAAYAALGVLSGPSSVAFAQDLNANMLAKQMEMLARLISAPEVMRIVQSPDADREKAAKDLIAALSNPTAVRNAGFDPANLRMSLRVFENDIQQQRSQTLAISRHVGRDGLVRGRTGMKSPEPITDEDLRREIPRSAPLVPTDNPAAGVCVSYGRNLCVSGGVP